jgi:hypothetical protein
MLSSYKELNVWKSMRCVSAFTISDVERVLQVLIRSLCKKARAT